MSETPVNPFRIEKKNRLDKELTTDKKKKKKKKVMKESMDTIQNKTQKFTMKKSTEDTVTESLDRKQL